MCSILCWIVQWPASRGFRRCPWWLTSTSPWRVVKAWSTGPGTLKIRSSSRRVSLFPSQQVRDRTGLADSPFSLSDSTREALAHNTGNPQQSVCKKSHGHSPGMLPKCDVLCHSSCGQRRVYEYLLGAFERDPMLLPALAPVCVDLAFSACF